MNRTHRREWETFRLRIVGGGPLKLGSQFALQAYNGWNAADPDNGGNWIQAVGGGGQGVLACGGGVGSWETLTAYWHDMWI